MAWEVVDANDACEGEVGGTPIRSTILSYASWMDYDLCYGGHFSNKRSLNFCADTCGSRQQPGAERRLLEFSSLVARGSKASRLSHSSLAFPTPGLDL